MQLQLQQMEVQHYRSTKQADFYTCILQYLSFLFWLIYNIFLYMLKFYQITPVGSERNSRIFNDKKKTLIIEYFTAYSSQQFTMARCRPISKRPMHGLGCTKTPEVRLELHSTGEGVHDQIQANERRIRTKRTSTSQGGMYLTNQMKREITKIRNLVMQSNI